MQLSVKLRSALVADAHSAQGLTWLALDRPAADSPCLQYCRGHGHAGVNLDRLAIDRNRKESIVPL
jgi:hypothetical protein